MVNIQITMAFQGIIQGTSRANINFKKQEGLAKPIAAEQKDAKLGGCEISEVSIKELKTAFILRPRKKEASKGS